MGRMSKFDATIRPRFDEIKQARVSGASLDDLAVALGVARSSIYRWMGEYPEFKQLMDDAEVELHQNIEFTAHHSLMNKLTDRMVTYEQIIEDGVVVREKRKLIPADTTAIIFALKARNPNKWDSLGVARLKDEQKNQDLGAQILEQLGRYQPKGTKNG